MVIASSSFSVFAYFLPTGYASILTEAEDSSEKLVPYYKKSHPGSIIQVAVIIWFFLFITSVHFSLQFE